MDTLSFILDQFKRFILPRGFEFTSLQYIHNAVVERHVDRNSGWSISAGFGTFTGGLFHYGLELRDMGFRPAGLDDQYTVGEGVTSCPSPSFSPRPLTTGVTAAVPVVKPESINSQSNLVLIELRSWVFPSHTSGLKHILIRVWCLFQTDH